jgi:hypothetical protein
VRWPDDYPSRSPGIPDLRPAAERADCGRYAKRLRQPGRYLDLAGFDVSATRPVIDNINTAVAAARAAGMLIIWFQNGWDDQYVEAGGPGSPNYHKSNALKTMRSVLSCRASCWRKAAGIISWWMS